MTSIAPLAPPRKVIVGVDTHKHLHVAVAIDHNGARLAEHSASADTAGYAQLETWANSLGAVEVFGIEGTGSYGVGLASFLRRRGHRIIEVNRGDRRSRRQNGKSDTLDAEAAARSILSGSATSIPKNADGLSEMIRQVKVARDTARKARSSAIIALKAMIVNAPAELRESLEGLGDKALLERCAGFRIRTMDSTTASAKHTLRSLARRWLLLDQEIKEHDVALDQMTEQASPTLRDGFGIGPDTAAEILVVLGDNPDRIRSEAAFAKLCGDENHGNSPRSITEIPHPLSDEVDDKVHHNEVGPFKAGGAHANQPEGTHSPCSHREKTWKHTHSTNGDGRSPPSPDTSVGIARRSGPTSTGQGSRASELAQPLIPSSPIATT